MRAFRNILVVVLGAAAVYLFNRSHGDRVRNALQSAEDVKSKLADQKARIIDITDSRSRGQAQPDEAEAGDGSDFEAEFEPQAEPEAELHAVPEPQAEPDESGDISDSPEEPLEPEAPTWVQPTQGECPLSHQIKARFATGRYHEPGTKSYDKVVADCCYATVEEAERDGFSRSRW